MSSYTRRCVGLYQVQCRVNLDSALGCTRSNVELNSTVRWVVPGPVSSYTRRCDGLYQVQCRVKLDSALGCTSSTVELTETVRWVVPAPLSRWNRRSTVQCFMLFSLSSSHTVSAVLTLKIRNFLKFNLDNIIEIHEYFGLKRLKIYILRVKIDVKIISGKRSQGRILSKISFEYSIGL